MATLFDSVVTQNNVWRGAGRVVYAASGTSFPGALDSIIQPATPADPHGVAYTLGGDWNDLGGTTEDGVTVTREFEGQDGVPVDQLKYQLFEGDPDIWRMRVGMSLLETDYEFQ